VVRNTLVKKAEILLDIKTRGVWKDK